MNKQIKLLAEQAGMHIVEDRFSTHGKFAEKFAQLIVALTVWLVLENIFLELKNEFSS